MNKPTTSKDSPPLRMNLSEYQCPFGTPYPLEMTMSGLTNYMKGTPNQSQIGGKHYKKCEIQPWDFVIANDLDYFQGSIIKYVTRWKDKGWIEDLKKARHFLDKYIETMEDKHKDMYTRPE